MRALTLSLVLAGLYVGTPLRAAAHADAALEPIAATSSLPAWLIGALLAAMLPVASRFGRWKGLRRAGAAVAVISLVAVVAQTGPHLVHHVLDPDQGARCQLLQTAQHGDEGLIPDAVEVAIHTRASLVQEASTPLPPPARARDHRSRAPPA